MIYYPDEQDRLNWKIAILRTLINDLIIWYHVTLGHAGEQRLYATVHQRYHHPKLRDLRKQTVQGKQHKQSGKGCGYHAPGLARLDPWTEVAVDLISPWKYYNEETEIEYTFNALTCIDTVKKFVEIIRIRCKNSSHIAQKFANCWISRFPKPNYCIHDSGGELIGHEFQDLLTKYVIIKIQKTVNKRSQMQYVKGCIRR